MTVKCDARGEMASLFADLADVNTVTRHSKPIEKLLRDSKL